MAAPYGLKYRGPESFVIGDDGALVWDMDWNTAQIESALTELDQKIEQVKVANLPNVIDGGTF